MNSVSELINFGSCTNSPVGYARGAQDPRTEKGAIAATCDERTMKVPADHAVAPFGCTNEITGIDETIIAKFVTENLNIGAEDAKNYGVIERVATTLEELLDVVDGIDVEVAEKGQLAIQTKNAAVHYFGASIRVRVLRTISDPMIAYLLFTLGVYGVIFGFLPLDMKEKS